MPSRIAFVSPTGWGNLGDAAIIEALIHGIRRRLPDPEIVGFTQNPDDTAARHGIRAFTASGFALETYAVREPRGEGAPARVGKRAGWSLLKRVVGVVPGARGGARLAKIAIADRRHRRVTSERIRAFDYVVVAGGGQLDDFWGGPFGHPYTLWRWGGLARRAGARYVILSVGTGSLSTPLSRLFVRRALALAEYRSFRDGRSRELVGAPALTAGDPVVPDLAYSLPADGWAAPPPPTERVGLSPMVYGDPLSWPVQDANRYRHHLDTFTDLAVRIARSGREVGLFTSDKPDRRPLAELQKMIEARLEGPARARVSAADVDGVAGLMRLFGTFAVVVAARLHGVLLGHVAGRPALAIAHERKVATLMADMGQERFCLDIDGFDPENGWQRLEELLARRAELGAELQRRVADNRRRVEAQYDQVFGGAP
jgi:polysaccharide pyruvyl transferase WcaK-like protein